MVEVRNDNSLILYNSWKLTLNSRNTIKIIGVLIGLTNDNVQWAWFRYEHLPEYEQHARKDWSLKKAELGHADAQWQLYNKLPYEENLVWLCRAADQGHIRAIHQLADLYYYGSDHPRNVANSKFAKDVPKGCMLYYLAWRTQNGKWPVTEDPIFRLGPYEISDIVSLAEAMSTHELSEAEKLFLTWKPDQCDRDFSLYLGQEYQRGFIGVDLIKGTYLANLCMEADKGSISARETLGRIYQFGSYGISPDLPRAYMWFLLAADAHIPEDSEQSRCREMTAIQRSQAKKYLDVWKPGKCEQELAGEVQAAKIK